MSTLTFTIPKASWLTSNRHIVNRGYRQRIVDELHAIAQITAMGAHLQPISGPMLVDWTVRYPKGVSWIHGDAANAQPTTKALLDGLVPRWLEGDGPQHVVRESFQRGPNLTVASDHEITLVLTPQEVPW